MLTYDAVLCIQERLYDNGSVLAEASGEVVTKAKLTPATILEKARQIVESLIQILVKAVQSFGTFLRNLIDDGQKHLGEAIKNKVDKNFPIDGLKIRGYTFGGLNHQMVARYKSANVDRFLEEMRIPRIESMNDLEDLAFYKTDGMHASMNRAAAIAKDKDSAKFIQDDWRTVTVRDLIKYMTGINVIESDPDKCKEELMIRLWGSKDPIFLEGGKDFTLGDCFKVLAAPPLAKSVLKNYQMISKRLYSVKKLLPFITKRKTMVGKAQKVERQAELTYMHNATIHKKTGASKEEAKSMDYGDAMMYNNIRVYVVFMKNLARDMNVLNKALLNTVAAQHRQAVHIIQKVVLIATKDVVLNKDIDFTPKEKRKFGKKPNDNELQNKTNESED